MTSSPGFQRVTPSPTFQTMPEASEPPMWWSSSGCERKTETGLPSAAQTLLKFTPAAITRTITSNAPGCGTSICSSWKASIGSPSRSCRITQAAIVSGRVPGSTPTSVTSVRSTCATDSSGVGRPGMVPSLGSSRAGCVAVVEHQHVAVRVRERRHVADARVDRVGHEADALALELLARGGHVAHVERDRVRAALELLADRGRFHELQREAARLAFAAGELAVVDPGQAERVLVEPLRGGVVGDEHRDEVDAGNRGGGCHVISDLCNRRAKRCMLIGCLADAPLRRLYC